MYDTQILTKQLAKFINDLKLLTSPLIYLLTVMIKNQI